MKVRLSHWAEALVTSIREQEVEAQDILRRIAELEADRDALKGMLSRQADTLIARRETIDQAAAELEKASATKPYVACAYAANALAILRGELT